MTSDCRASRPDEVARIVSNGGFVNNKRVNGQLAVSRALGDVEFKTPRSLVTASPELSEIRLQEKDEFLLIACDGLWDVLTSEEAIKFIRDRLNQDSNSGSGTKMVTSDRLSSIADELVKHAIDDKKSSDNVSVLIAKVVSPELDGGLFQSSTISTSSKISPNKDVKVPFDDDDDDDDDFDAPDTKSTIPQTVITSSSTPGPPLHVKGASIDTDEGLMDFLMDDANFKD